MSPMLALPERPVARAAPVVERTSGRPLLRMVGLASITGFAYRRRAQADAFMMVAFVLAITAVAMVYVRPF